MNGRAYDYNLGRFLSVDPFIQAPGNSQSMNPYSYIMNNPLAGTDPSGYKSICKTDNYCDKEILVNPNTLGDISVAWNNGKPSHLIFHDQDGISNIMSIGKKERKKESNNEIYQENVSQVHLISTGSTASPKKSDTAFTYGNYKSSLKAELRKEVDELLTDITYKFIGKIFDNLEGPSGLIETIDIEIMKVSLKYDIEIGFHVYKLSGGGYFASQIFTSYHKSTILNTYDYLIPGLINQLAAGYHTHGGTITEDVDYFTGKTGDAGHASWMTFKSGNYDYKYYLSSPTGVLKVLDAGQHYKTALEAEKREFGGAEKVPYEDFIRHLRGRN